MGAYFQGGLIFQLFSGVKDQQGPRGLIFNGGSFSRGAYYSEFTVTHLDFKKIFNTWPNKKNFINILLLLLNMEFFK